MLLRDQFSLDPRKLFFPPTLRPGCVSSIIQRRLWLLKTWGLPSLLLLHWFLLSCRSVLSLLKPKDAPSHRDPLFAGLKCQASSKSVRGEVLGEGMWQSTGPPSFPFFSPHKQQAARWARPAIQALHALCRFFVLVSEVIL